MRDAASGPVAGTMSIVILLGAVGKKAGYFSFFFWVGLGDGRVR